MVIKKYILKETTNEIVKSQAILTSIENFNIQNMNKSELKSSYVDSILQQYQETNNKYDEDKEKLEQEIKHMIYCIEKEKEFILDDQKKKLLIQQERIQLEEEVKSIKEDNIKLQKDYRNVSCIVESQLKIKEDNNKKRKGIIEQNLVIRPFNKSFLLLKTEPNYEVNIDKYRKHLTFKGYSIYTNGIISLFKNKIEETKLNKKDTIIYKNNELCLITGSFIKKIIDSVNENNQQISNLGYNCYFINVESNCNLHIYSIIENSISLMKGSNFILSIHEISCNNHNESPNKLNEISNNKTEDSSNSYALLDNKYILKIAEYSIDNDSLENLKKFLELNKNKIGFIIKFKSRVNSNFFNIVVLNYSKENINWIDFNYLLRILKDNSFVLSILNKYTKPYKKVINIPNLISGLNEKSPRKLKLETLSVSKERSHSNFKYKNEDKDKKLKESKCLNTKLIEEIQEEKSIQEQFVLTLLIETDYIKAKYNNVIINTNLEEIEENKTLQSWFLN